SAGGQSLQFAYLLLCQRGIRRIRRQANVVADVRRGVWIVVLLRQHHSEQIFQFWCLVLRIHIHACLGTLLRLIKTLQKVVGNGVVEPVPREADGIQPQQLVGIFGKLVPLFFIQREL